MAITQTEIVEAQNEKPQPYRRRRPNPYRRQMQPPEGKLAQDDMTLERIRHDLTNNL